LRSSLATSVSMRRRTHCCTTSEKRRNTVF
jgi:hypothetical protein